MGVTYPILQIVGYQNSGKTTLVEKIVQAGSSQGLRVATIKHHGHDKKIERVTSKKDSVRHLDAGASLTTVSAGGVIQLEASKSEGWTLDELIQLYSFFGYDLLLIEGYKFATYPKIVLIREKKDIELLSTLQNIVAVITWIPVDTSLPVFSIEDEETYIKWIFSSNEVKS